MQPDKYPTLRQVLRTFSILGRIGGDATGQQEPWEEGPPGLSVSSVGSEAMQRVKRFWPF